MALGSYRYQLDRRSGHPRFTSQPRRGSCFQPITRHDRHRPSVNSTCARPCRATRFRPPASANVRREFRKITESAGLGKGWAPLDLRRTFVSLMSADGVPVEEIARLAGHNRTATTELVYRHELRPVITTGAEVMDRILNGAAK